MPFPVECSYLVHKDLEVARSGSQRLKSTLDSKGSVHVMEILFLVMWERLLESLLEERAPI